MVRQKLAIDHEDTYYTSRIPQPMCKFLHNIWISLFPKYLSHCCCCLTVQYGVVSYSIMGITIVTIPIFINSTEGPNLVHVIAPFILMCIYSVTMIAGHFLTILSAFTFNRKILLIGMITTAAGMLIWSTLLILGFIPHSFEDYVCIKHVCAESQWLIDMRWRYRKRDCPFRKNNPIEYPAFRKEFFVDSPRDELWTPEKRQTSLNLVIKKPNQADKVINLMAWYPGCESDDTVLILISVILAAAYIAFMGHLWWMTFSLRYLIVEEEYEDDDDDYDDDDDEESY